MAQWQRNVCLNPEWEKAKDGLITPQELAVSIAKKLRAIPPFGAEFEDLNEQLAEIADEFECMGEDKTTSSNDIDSVMEDLYDWGDTPLDYNWSGKRVCFIDTISMG